MGKISTAEVLRLRAVSPVLSDRSARRFAQDDESVGEPEEKAVERRRSVRNSG
jgi:hypothetical protein